MYYTVHKNTIHLLLVEEHEMLLICLGIKSLRRKKITISVKRQHYLQDITEGIEICANRKDLLEQRRI